MTRFLKLPLDIGWSHFLPMQIIPERSTSGCAFQVGMAHGQSHSP